ncbi:ATP-grasp peptide maturase system methyltransferase [Streptomyces sp. TX20-6-3]|uniref:ATP-grasp peptide maturase system methyltransferase n=1 Tax=Streptomyces sp. TX20-6-3 TaxID=3028705 RepID=UPI0029AB95F6|nr:ATP-grasp peptide maturase system methyltransferase [Streptomyces sp. TX20-6-3]MDX2560161.1 ATP-grasp peptide maturase system methyltransferase [Streptomyces sp. TX20-6-3]
MSDDRTLREALADRLAADGHLRASLWRSAVVDTPRHEFLRGGYFRRVDGAGPTGWEPVMPEDPAWLPATYTDDSLVTQIAGTIVPGDIQGRIFRAPTSSSTMPSLVVRMLEELHLDDGMRVLEIGTGTGYSTALLCHRLGAGLVTSVEVDEEVSARARVALGAVGHTPGLIAGDGLAGTPDAEPYDRIVATCGVLAVPPAWLARTRPGGRILATVCGWMYSSELARLTVGDDGTARGRFLGGQVSFMLARPHLPAPLGVLPDLFGGEERETALGPGALDDWTTRFVAQLAAPRAQRVRVSVDGGEPADVVVDVGAGSWAVLRRDGERWIARQGGPDRLWDEIEDRVARWRQDGSPGLERFRIAVTPDGQSITWLR